MHMHTNNVPLDYSLDAALLWFEVKLVEYVSMYEDICITCTHMEDIRFDGFTFCVLPNSDHW